ncbi:MAG: winged helix DNA-binding domain-containing protein, partial [Deltaproteobacteria bacterium]|nr:winged helix DNA-binding domain-containing protein [Deltaproteobacteria bacterium]
MASAPVSIEQVLGHLARRQHLHPASRASDVVRLVDDIVALHATDPASVVLSAWARVDGFERGALERAIEEQRSLVRAICMRQTLHVVGAAALPMFFQALAERH